MKIKARNLPSIVWPLLILLVMLAFNFFFTRNFFHLEIKDGNLFGTLVDILKRSSVTMMIAIGMTLVIATGGIDISVGSICAITGALSCLLLSHGSPLGLAILIPIVLAIALGSWNAFLVTKIGLMPIIATLVVQVAGRGLAQLITGGRQIYFTGHAFDGFAFFGSGFLFGLPFAVCMTAAMLTLVLLLTRKTALGMFIEASGINVKAAKFAGVRVVAVTAFAYVLSALCAGLAGFVVASDIRDADPTSAGLNYELDAILAVVIGGTSMDGGKFSLSGSMVGALVVQTLTTTILMQGVPVNVTLVVRALVVVIICVLQSDRFKRLVNAEGVK